MLCKRVLRSPEGHDGQSRYLGVSVAQRRAQLAAQSAATAVSGTRRIIAMRGVEAETRWGRVRAATALVDGFYYELKPSPLEVRLKQRLAARIGSE